MVLLCAGDSEELQESKKPENGFEQVALRDLSFPTDMWITKWGGKGMEKKKKEMVPLTSLEMSLRHLNYPHRSGVGRICGRLCSPGIQTGQKEKGYGWLCWEVWAKFLSSTGCTEVWLSSSICVLAVSWRFISFPVSSCDNSALPSLARNGILPILPGLHTLSWLVTGQVFIQ